MFVSSRYDRATSEIDRLGRQPFDAREVLVERLQCGEDGQQRGPRDRFDNKTPRVFPFEKLLRGRAALNRAESERLVAQASVTASGCENSAAWWLNSQS